MLESLSAHSKRQLDNKDAYLTTSVAGSSEELPRKDKKYRQIYAENERKGDYHILVNTRPQLKAVLNSISEYGSKLRIYVDSDLFFSIDEGLAARVMSFAGENAAEFIVALPFVTRQEEFDGCGDILDIINNAASKGFTGILVRNLEQLGFVREHSYRGTVILDYGVYVWNQHAAELLNELNNVDGSFRIDEISVPLELTIHEAKELSKALDARKLMPRT